MAGALHGIRVVELAGIGPAPFAAMMLADHGAEVIRITRPGAMFEPTDILNRSRRGVTLDLKSAMDRDKLKELIRDADALIEGFRPGAMERLGLGPDILLAENPALVYGRMTGWGQEGPLAHAAGHDINYIALSGALHCFGRAGEAPVPPVNLVGDFGGGGMLLAFGLLAALLNARATGQGQVVDCAMTDGAALLLSMVLGFRAAGAWSDTRGTNLLDTGAPFYDVYETRDGKYIALGAIEPQFYAILREKLGLTDALFAPQNDPAFWPAQRAALAARIKTLTREECCARLDGSDACFAPVLSPAEAPTHPHNAARGMFVDCAGFPQPAPAPRFSRTPAPLPTAPAPPGGAAEFLAERGRTVA